MARPLLSAVEVPAKEPIAGSVVWLHGLGADGHDFETIVPELGMPRARFVFPHAPRRCVTVNMRLLMPAWYDIRHMHGTDGYDLEDVRESAEDVEALLSREKARGIPAGRIVLAGFSQGAAIALYVGLRHPEKLAGILALSTYLLEADKLEAERSKANLTVPIFQAHGLYDPMLPLPLGEQCRKTLETLGYSVTWKKYGMGHEVRPAEIKDIAAWLSERIPGIPIE